jgi:3-hydroxy-9,10-secoandrosta-1,3,5(10)-triene-9,17-dione monooxygenase reductase component
VGEVHAFEHNEHEPLVFKRGRFALQARSKPSRASAAASQALLTEGAFGEDFLIYLLGRAYHQLYARLRPQIERRNLQDADYLVLSLLGVRDARSLEQLNALLAYTALPITLGVAQRLRALGLIEFDPAAAAHAPLLLTHCGRRTVIELLAVAEAASTDAEKGLDPAQSRMLRQLLAHIVEASNPGIPHPWQA